MKILIDLDVTPEEFKKIQVFNIKMMNNKITHKVYEAVQKGIVLPKGRCEMTVEQILTEIYRNGCTDEVFLELSKHVISEKERMFYVQETVNTILNSCTSNTDVDKAFRNAARLVQNAIDGEFVDFEEIERSDEE